MNREIDTLLQQYEGGQISRRTFIAGMSALMLAANRAVAADAPQLPVASINHVTMFVKDVPKTAAFYQDLFGLSVKSHQGNGINLAVGEQSQFLGIFNGPPNIQPRIDHVCLGVKGFDVQASLRALSTRGVEGRVRMRDDTVPELYFNDPNGLSVQLQDETYCGGVGVLGNECKA